MPNLVAVRNTWMLSAFVAVATAWTPPSRSATAVVGRQRGGALRCCAGDFLAEARQGIVSSLEAKDSPESARICKLHASSIEPLCPAVWTPEYSDRTTAIQQISLALDELELASVGPLLTGAAFSPCDAECFPSFCLLSSTLPEHFGWYEFTTEAMFWKRPRLHAWFELCNYEQPFREAASRIEAVVKEIDYWSTIEVDVPTNNLRTSARRDA